MIEGSTGGGGLRAVEDEKPDDGAGVGPLPGPRAPVGSRRGTRSLWAGWAWPRPRSAAICENRPGHAPPAPTAARRGAPSRP